MLFMGEALSDQASFNAQHYVDTYGDRQSACLADWLQPQRLSRALRKSNTWLTTQSDNLLLSPVQRQWMAQPLLRLRLAFRDDDVAQNRVLPSNLAKLNGLVRQEVLRAATVLSGSPGAMTCVALYRQDVSLWLRELHSALLGPPKTSVDLSSSVAVATMLKETAKALRSKLVAVKLHRAWGLGGWFLTELLGFALVAARSPYDLAHSAAGRPAIHIATDGSVDSVTLDKFSLIPPGFEIQPASTGAWAIWPSHNVISQLRREPLWNAPLSPKQQLMMKTTVPVPSDAAPWSEPPFPLS